MSLLYANRSSNTDELEREEFEKECATDRIYEITQDLLGYQYRVGKNGEENECYVRFPAAL